MLKADLKAQLVTFIEDGSPESLADAMILAGTAVIDPEPVVEPGAVTAEGSRDETADSIDPTTGTLTDDAVAKRAAKRALDQAEEDVSAAELKVAEVEESDDEAEVTAANEKLDGAKQRLTAAQKRKEAADQALADDDAVEQSQVDAGGSEHVDGDAGGAMITVDPNDPAIQGGSDNAPITTGAVTTSKDLGA